MATAAKQARTLEQVRPSRRPGQVTEFAVVEENGGGYHWVIVAAGGEILARSESFASREDAERVACQVRDGDGSGQLEGAPRADRPVHLVARRRTAVARHESDAERWLDERPVHLVARRRTAVARHESDDGPGADDGASVSTESVAM